MPKFTIDAVLDEIIDRLATASRLTICSAQPANFAGIAAVTLASIAMTPGAGNGDYTKGDGDVSGRKLTILQQAAIAITSSGTANHICFDDGTTLLAGTTCTSQVLTAGGTVTIPQFKAEISDPA